MGRRAHWVREGPSSACGWKGNLAPTPTLHVAPRCLVNKQAASPRTQLSSVGPRGGRPGLQGGGSPPWALRGLSALNSLPEPRSHPPPLQGPQLRSPSLGQVVGAVGWVPELCAIVGAGSWHSIPGWILSSLPTLATSTFQQKYHTLGTLFLDPCHQTFAAGVNHGDQPR